ncbi:MAG: Stk1 family PASTA domain-containing Ser/Thr kinase [Parolsenella sp.]|uniref:Stk1 family PASTA domain-containing Ser/Thr kinase n=1 Tax=Parolsenella sp. TaxID=2083006 RepID=UPI002A7526EE|nr:Stk1 family PASTA domain-containing Ser/Thr kinase [Parolsenella sp.]MDY3292526.1 Stk1 family PASTA domain-containing Ser/Thr kinase [Parolsenella sp.]
MADKLLGGRYAVQDRIGIGGMATVYRGLDQVLGRTVAIKMMLPQYATDPSFAARFKQEAQAAAALQSPYIVGVYDWGKDGDTYYIVMEYLRGTDLKTGIRNHGALDCRKVAQIGSQICQALSEAHRHDIIHRDIKPQNIMVQPNGNIKVMDFGIARAKNSHLTADNSVLGTAHYVSPEQTQGKELGPTSDLYSLGIVMYEAATGRVPFDGDDAISVALKQVNEQPVPPSQVNPNVDATLEGIILKCMRKNPAERFQTADELRRVLNDYLAGRIVNLGEATSLISAGPTQAMNRQQAGGRTQAMPRAAVGMSPATTGRIPTAQTNLSGMQVPEEKPKSKGKVAAIVIGVIAAIAIIAGVAMSIFGGNSSTKAMPNLEGMTADEATAKLAEYGDGWFVVSTSEQYDDNIEEGKLVSQDPARNTQCEKGTKVKLVFSKGKEPAATVKVPDLKNLTPAQAEEALAAVNLKGTVGDSVESTDVESGKVASQDQQAGSNAKEGDTITYHISTGVGSADAGNHAGWSKSSAISDLNSAGFTNIDTSNSQYSDEVEAGCVISQSPTGKQGKDTQITLIISKGSRPSSGGNGGNAGGNTSTSGGGSETPSTDSSTDSTQSNN